MDGGAMFSMLDRNRDGVINPGDFGYALAPGVPSAGAAGCYPAAALRAASPPRARAVMAPPSAHPPAAAAFAAPPMTGRPSVQGSAPANAVKYLPPVTVQAPPVFFDRTSNAHAQTVAGIPGGGYVANTAPMQTVPIGLASQPLAPAPVPTSCYAAPPEARMMTRPGDEQPTFFQRHITREELIAEGNLFQAPDTLGGSLSAAPERSFPRLSASFAEQPSSYVPPVSQPAAYAAQATTLLQPDGYAAGQPMDFLDQLQREAHQVAPAAFPQPMGYTTVPSLPVGAPYSVQQSY